MHMLCLYSPNSTAPTQESWVASLVTATPRALEGKSHPPTPTAGEIPLYFVMKAKTLKKDCISLAFLVKPTEIINLPKQKQKMLSDVRNSASNFALQKIFVVC